MLPPCYHHLLLKRSASSIRISKYNKKEQKLISRIYGILNAILPKDMATMVINKIQEELSK